MKTLTSPFCRKWRGYALTYINWQNLFFGGGCRRLHHDGGGFAGLRWAEPLSLAAFFHDGWAFVIVEKGDLSVPLHIRNAPTRLMKDLDYGKGYEYSHEYENNFSDQEYLPKEISGMRFYVPGKNPREEELRKRLKALWKDKYGY